MPGFAVRFRFRADRRPVSISRASSGQGAIRRNVIYVRMGGMDDTISKPAVNPTISATEWAHESAVERPPVLLDVRYQPGGRRGFRSTRRGTCPAPSLSTWRRRSPVPPG
ncbi:hypothetical protein GCM10020000_20160 [Streptomyces olivoverticillatus]